jgi:hypothetical protein
VSQIRYLDLHHFKTFISDLSIFSKVFLNSFFTSVYTMMFYIPFIFHSSNVINSGVFWMTGVRFLAGAGTFSPFHHSQTSSGAHQASCPMGTRAPSSGPGNEAGHSPIFSAKVKNTWSYTTIPPYIFMAWCLVKHVICLHGVALS